MKLELSRRESLLLIESLTVRIKNVEQLILSFTTQSLVDSYTDELNELVELKKKIILLTNEEYFLLLSQNQQN